MNLPSLRQSVIHIAFALALTLIGLGCGGGDGGGGSNDGDSPSDPSSAEQITLRSVQVGGSGAIRLSSTSSSPTVGGGRASLGQVSPVGIIGGGTAPTLLAGFWRVAERAPATDPPPSIALLSIAAEDASLPEPEAMKSREVADASRSSTKDASNRAGKEAAPEGAPDEALAFAESPDHPLTSQELASREPASVPSFSNSGRLVLALIMTVGMMSRFSSSNRRRP